MSTKISYIIIILIIILMIIMFTINEGAFYNINKKAYFVMSLVISLITLCVRVCFIYIYEVKGQTNVNL